MPSATGSFVQQSSLFAGVPTRRLARAVLYTKRLSHEQYCAWLSTQTLFNTQMLVEGDPLCASLSRENYFRYRCAVRPALAQGACCQSTPCGDKEEGPNGIKGQFPNGRRRLPLLCIWPDHKSCRPVNQTAATMTSPKYGAKNRLISSEARFS